MCQKASFSENVALEVTVYTGDVNSELNRHVLFIQLNIKYSRAGHWRFVNAVKCKV